TADRAWIGVHANALVDLFSVVQQDRTLTALLASAPPVTTIDEHLEAVVTRLIARVEHASAPSFRSPGIGAALARLHMSRHPLNEVPLVPAHTDPSPSNVLVASGRIYLVDWDGITLSDPMRDIGLLLWWCAPPERWAALLERFWLPDANSAASIDRIYWWSAVNSLRAALWIDRHTSDEGAIASFLEDFREAEARRPNPKRSAV
ncbi:MAG TPA: phosphotransferase, partial [Thermomicrobiales bacterium]|nr:phosphotransferase [Thermomicrobiales bacterium]